MEIYDKLAVSITGKVEKLKKYLQSLNKPTKIALALLCSLASRYIGIKIYKKVKKLPPGILLDLY